LVQARKAAADRSSTPSHQIISGYPLNEARTSRVAVGRAVAVSTYGSRADTRVSAQYMVARLSGCWQIQLQWRLHSRREVDTSRQARLIENWSESELRATWLVGWLRRHLDPWCDERSIQLNGVHVDSQKSEFQACDLAAVRRTSFFREDERTTKSISCVKKLRAPN